MKIAISGSTGLIGSALRGFFGSSHDVVRIVRRPIPAANGSVLWNPERGEIEKEKLEGFDAVINLAGESIGARWTKELKRKIRESRIGSAGTLSRAISNLDRPPSVFFCASAIGYYGDRGDEVIDETGRKGLGFLSDVVEEWERSTDIARDAGIRVVNLRFGPVLSEKGGTLKKLLPAFKLGLGGSLGSGKQFLSWVAIDEIPLIVKHLITNKTVRGPVNVVSPYPLTNKEFTDILGRALKMPTLFGVPSFILKLLLGEMAKEVILSSVRVMPKRLIDHNYLFKHGRLEEYFKSIFRKIL